MKKILLIEDNPDVRYNTAEILKLAGYEVFTAENGKEGVELAMDCIPNLIICDVLMPVLDGYGVLNVIQGDVLLRNTPFIFLTSKTDRSDYRKAMDLGADDFMSKPFSVTELLSAIESRLSKAAKLGSDIIKGSLQGEQERKKWGQRLFSIPEAKRLVLKKRTPVFHEGSVAQQLIFVESGILKTHRSNGSGKSLITNLHFRHEVVGLPDVILNKTYSCTAETVSDAVVFVISQPDFKEYLIQHPTEAGSIPLFLAEDFNAKCSQLVDMAYTPMKERVDNLMTSLEKQLDDNRLDDIHYYFTREELAQMAGTATESLIRVLGGKQ